MKLTQENETRTGQAEFLEDKAAVLSVRQLMWLRFKRSHPAIYSGIFLIFMYLVAIFAGFLAPYGVRTTHSKYPLAAPNPPRFIDRDGNFHWRPFVNGLKREVDPETFRRKYVPDGKIYPLRFFVKGESYKILGFINADRHFVLPEEPGKLFLLGTDRRGRDLFSRILFGAQVSLTVGLVGVSMSLVIGSFIGTLTGFYGGTVDMVSQRLIEVLMSFPQIPLWLALASAVPANWSSIKVYFGISIVLSIVNWGALARQVRGRVLSLREEDFVIAARYTNCSDLRIIVRHLFPNTLSHVLVSATLAIPAMIIGETALSFLGLGIRPPMTSWGVLLTEAQQVRVFMQQPWLLTPAIFVIVTVIAFNFLGDGIRDAADPFAS